MKRIKKYDCFRALFLVRAWNVQARSDLISIRPGEIVVLFKRIPTLLRVGCYRIEYFMLTCAGKIVMHKEISPDNSDVSFQYTFEMLNFQERHSS